MSAAPLIVLALQASVVLTVLHGHDGPGHQVLQTLTAQGSAPGR